MSVDRRAADSLAPEPFAGLPTWLHVADDDVEVAMRAALERPHATLRRWRIEPVSHAISAPTTAALVRIHVVAVHSGELLSCSMFLKVLQSFRHAWHLDALPAQSAIRVLSDSVWSHESDIYASDVRHALPAGLRMPRLYHLQHLGQDRIAMWLEDVPAISAPWDMAQYERAARLSVNSRRA